MREREVKVLNIDKEEIEKKLIDIGAVLVKDEDQINYRFDTDDYYLKKTYDAYLRIRITKNNLSGETINTMTFKRNLKRDSLRINEEVNTDLSNWESAAKIIEILGYKQKRPGYKHRRSYMYDNILFEIDTWDEETYAKPYLEIEVSSDEELEKAIMILNIDRSQITTKPIDEMRKD
ncbi:MAG TPA: class IV adenylate cyclase [Sedimentibacter sp.]|nr:class IV adenylate cyclase [Sedimentibacter sp.]HNZ83506.1 class IV adenylate cyclase [Sedimentibacter sp.]HOH69715.1 class IV adenylate cyclase [Sedimentibacter sp.]HPW99341.1 class IV adenylate cyclase [Sedimentibacter sp.]HQB62931.1 class IV adenylate cyclase [Sedimentibacter sp.]